MKRSATLVAGVLVLLAATPAFAQAPAAGDEFVFFVEGVNPQIPTSSAVLATDPDDAENNVLSFGGGNFANPSFTWPAATGFDLSVNRADRDTLFLRLRMGPGTFDENGHGNIYLMLLDSESLNGNGDPGDDDIAFRAIWPVPDSLYDDAWHDVAIALPPATVAALDSAKVDKDVNGNPLPAAEQYDAFAKNWVYQGGYNSDGATFVTPGSELFKDFEWDAVFSVGFFWDQPGGLAGNVLVDDMYIGSENTDLSPYQGGAPAYAGTVSVTDNGNSSVTVSFSAQEDVGGYRLYLVESDGIAVDDTAKAQFVRRFAADAAELSLTYKVFSPHPSIPNPTVTFAVTAEGVSGVENETPVYASAEVMGAQPQGFVFGLTPAEVDGLFDAFTTGTLTTDFLDLDRATPFRMDATHGTAENPDRIADAGDFEAVVYIGYAPDPEDANETIVLFYADVTDDALVFDTDNGQGGPTSTEPYLFDRFALFLGTYRVTFPIGSTHAGMAATDYAINFQPLRNGEDVVVNAGIAASDLFSAPLFEEKANGQGYRMLAAFLMSEIGEGVAFEAPAADEIAYFPLIVGYDEQDGSGGFNTRTNVVTSEKANVNFVNPGWYASPLQWPATAFAGADVEITAVEGEAPAATFALRGNAPNPVSGAARVGFSLDAAGPVALEVFNVLGQRVARIVDGVVYQAGDHSVAFDARGLAAGLYVLRLEAGGRTATHSMIVMP